mmetsp:Transcript_21158/g.23731  ORF Transcript_21158/g.23731 Transcript_21158/m.23731 type:complete len:636 (+) Transcript_21158:119-2026(+)
MDQINSMDRGISDILDGDDNQENSFTDHDYSTILSSNSSRNESMHNDRRFDPPSKICGDAVLSIIKSFSNKGSKKKMERKKKKSKIPTNNKNIITSCDLSLLPITSCDLSLLSLTNGKILTGTKNNQEESRQYGDSNVERKKEEEEENTEDSISSSSTTGDNIVSQHPSSHYASTTKLKRELPHWTRSTDDEEAKYADWMLDVSFSSITTTTTTTNNDSADVISYLVHRYFLGTKGDYFEDIFRRDTNDKEDGCSESHQKRSAIQLPAPFVTIGHFESLLDYLYTGKSTLDCNNAIAMVYFGDYFGIIPLKEESQSFICKSITAAIEYAFDIRPSMESSDKLATFYDDAKGLAMDDLQEAIVYACANNPTLMWKDTALSKILDVQFWYRVLAARKCYPQTELSNKLWSVNVANFIELISGIMDREGLGLVFHKLTHKSSLPIISAKAAIMLIEQEQQLCVYEKVDVEKENRDKNFACLQQRCIDAFIDSKTREWKISHPRTLLEGILPRSVLESMLLYTIHGRKKPIKCHDFIEVTGAGIACVNGVYTKTGLHKEYPLFTKSGTHKGREDWVYIYKYGNGLFYISLVPNGVDVGIGEGIDFYVSVNDELPVGTDGSWERCKKGCAPYPTLQFVEL